MVQFVVWLQLQALARQFLDHAKERLERSHAPSGKNAEYYARFTQVANALSRASAVLERLAQASRAPAAAVHDRDTAWAMGLGGPLVGSSLREALSSHVLVPDEVTELHSMIERDGKRVFEGHIDFGGRRR